MVGWMGARIGARAVERSVVPLPGPELRFLVCPCVAYHCSYWLNYLESKNNGRGNKGEKETNQKGIKWQFVCLVCMQTAMYICPSMLCLWFVSKNTSMIFSIIYYLKVTIFFKSKRVLNLFIAGRLRSLACWDWEFEPRRGRGENYITNK